MNSSIEGLGGDIEVRHCFMSISATNSTPLSTGVLILNIYLILPLLTSSIDGLDSSLVNGQSNEIYHSASVKLICARSSNSAFLASVLQSPRRKGIGSVDISISSYLHDS